jgi:hypothetical protein
LFEDPRVQADLAATSEDDGSDHGPA